MIRALLAILLLAVGFGLAGGPVLAADGAAAVISEVKVTPAFFNPSLGQKEEISFRLTHRGTVQLDILDRDGVLIRKLAKQNAEPGKVTVLWDGKNDAGEVVADEAYSCKVSFTGSGRKDTYDPRGRYSPVMDEVKKCTYSRTEGVLSYTLPWPARVFIQAGQAKLNSTTQQREGPVLKMVVDGQPRAAGSVIENWNGFDESGAIYIADLPNFTVGIAMMPLPENVIITTGNRKGDFFDYALRHRSAKAISPRTLDVAANNRRVGLSALEDRCPSLKIESKAMWDAKKREYQVQKEPLTLNLTIDKKKAAYFLNPSAQLTVFVDDAVVLTEPRPTSPTTITIPVEKLQEGEHRIVVNWFSGTGTAAVNAVRVRVASSQGKS